MKVAVIGSGKTGGHVTGLIDKANVVGPFGRTNRVSSDKLKEADVGIIFVPGEAFIEMIPELLKSKKPMVVGATGMEWPADLDQTLKAQGTAWVYATNFSLGIQLFRQLIKTVNKLQNSLPSFRADLLDIHHTKKLDAPSGTAKSLAAWSDFPVEISARREGDVVGFHELTLTFPQETVKVSHNAHDRALFAQGALDVANIILKNPLGAGLHPLEKLMDHLEQQ